RTNRPERLATGRDQIGEVGDIVSESAGDFISVRLGDFVGIRRRKNSRTWARLNLRRKTGCSIPSTPCS
ncbi:hypothetical protein, partial [Bradyrhizobium brasilense]|uniref:hypothetical protein n=1 Tax=Bradyrhizobium brasilense TaxID=1419277 RepID=UPI001AEEF437